MSKDSTDIDQEKFDEAVNRLKLAFSRSDSKGSTFFAIALLPKDQENKVEDNYSRLKTAFAQKPEQLPLVKEIIDDLKFIRSAILANEQCRVKIEDVATELAKLAGETKALRAVSR